MDSLYFEKLRISRLPKRVSVLFVGESRPASGKFFYLGDSALATETQLAFTEVYGKHFESFDNFLNFFEAKQCYLDDLCQDPVNGIKDKAKRDKLCRLAIPKLAKKIRAADPKAIIVVMKGIKQFVDRAVLDAKLGSMSVYYLPFPAFSKRNKENFRLELIETLRELEHRGVLPKPN